MELKVWVEGIQRIVCGVTVNTTCQDVVFALAHATGKVGRFTLIERWRNNERLLAPNENPLKLLLKWGEYANDVQFILQRSESKQQQQQQQHVSSKHEIQQQNNNNNHNNTNNNENTTVMSNKKSLGLSNNSQHVIDKQNNNNNNNTTTNPQQQTQTHQKPLTMELSLNAAHERAKELKKSFGVHDAKSFDNIGIVKGVPQRNKSNLNNTQPNMAATTSSSAIIPRHEKSHSNPIEMPSSAGGNNGGKGNGAYHEFNNNNNNNNNTSNNIYQQLGAHNSKSINEINLAEVRNALDRRTMALSSSSNNHQAATATGNNHTSNNSGIQPMGGSAEIIFTSNFTSSPSPNSNHNNSHAMSTNAAGGGGGGGSNENLLDIYNGNSKFAQAPAISANGALVPPPYRDPPPPRNSPLQQPSNVNASNALYSNQPIQQPTTASGSAAAAVATYQNQSQDYDFVDYQQINDLVLPVSMDESESIFQATQYNDLLQLIKFQREKINQQQMELTKYDAEIVYLESKERDQAQELEAISREISKADQLFRQGSEQLLTLQYVEEENELVKQQEKTLKSEIALLRSKLANCETELLQCKNKIRLLMDDIEIEQRANSKQNMRQNVERDFLMEMERIQSEIDQAIHNTDTSNKTAESLKKEILLIENAIQEKKRQVEQLVNEMKEVNLQSLTVTTSEEIKHFLEGSNKPGSSRRIIGSPRQLENAVPTSKNPHGVWV
ncbi:probable serine/threonine-protein kinase DDB_G0282963 [Musca vetustissima]|uniref:probable serine/threonine-protein kinase DDB_G0282963 n=1 Tax=Musca vetustissima TaxID=27455 RepID=UPI002AB6E33E|nr:probable serine/threonine-protein kinase DDB_G0282963 [Musca vetustissima]